MNNKRASGFKFMTLPYGLGLFIFLLLFIVSLFPLMGIDEGVWSYIGTAWGKFEIPPLKGALDDKTQGIHIIYAVSNLLFGVNVWFARLLGCMALTWSSFIIYSICLKLRNYFAGITAMLVFGLAMAWRSVDGAYTAQTESFMVLFNLLAIKMIVDIYWEQPKRFFYKLFLCGFFIGCALSFKQTALFSAAAVVIIYYLVNRNFKLGNRNFLFGLLFISLGCITSLILFYIPLLLSAVSVMDYFCAAWLNILSMFASQSGSAASTAVRINGFSIAWGTGKIVLFYPLIILFFIYRLKLKNEQKFFLFYGLLIWQFFDFLSVNAVGYYWSHQFKQIIPSFAVISGLSLSGLLEKSTRNPQKTNRNFYFLLVIITLLWFPYGTVADRFNQERTDDFRKLGNLIEKNTQSDDYVYVFATLNYGYGMIVQAYSQRKSPTRYFAPFSLGLNGAAEKISNDIIKKNTRLVVVPSAIKNRLPQPIRAKISEYYV
ncbi:glycosyltransferase family 39 protein, partial [bacterium]|nr:glycosyltransferase family 39 protein [bacterium]